jgi:DNA polymerase III subunit epsilon
VLAPHPQARGRFDAFWIAGGRVVDWGALPHDAAELESRSDAALQAAPRPELGGWLAAGEVAEARLVGAWVAAHDPPTLELDARAGERDRVVGWVRAVESRA